MVAVRGTEMSGWVLPIDKFLEVHWCAAIDTLIGQETDLILNPEPNRKPVKFMEDWCDVLRFTHPHQDPGSAVLNVLQSLQAPTRDPDEECIAVVEPGGDKGMNQLLCIGKGEGGAEFRDVPEVKECSLTNKLNMGVK